MKIIADYHTHSCYSHGVGTIKENIEVAIKKNLQQIAIADHGPRSFSFRQFGVTEANTLLKIKKEVDQYNKYYSEIDILAAVEANIINLAGELDVPKTILDELDMVLVGFHLFFKPPNLNSAFKIIVDNFVSNKLKIRQEKIRKRNTELILKVFNNYDIDILTHPGYQVDIDTKILAQGAAKENVALEINAKHGFLTEEFVRTAAKYGANFSLGSDAHTPKQVGEVKSALEIVEQLDLSKSRVINIE